MKSESFVGLTTGEIPLPEPAVDAGAADSSAPSLPRPLAERAARSRSKRRAILLAALLAAVAGLQILALVLPGRPRPLLLYVEPPDPPPASGRPR